MNVLFYPLRKRVNKRGLAPLMIRVTLSSNDRCEISTGKSVEPALWDIDRKRVSGRSANADIVNKYIVNTESKLFKIETTLENDEVQYNAEIIKNVFLGKHIQKFTLLDAFGLYKERLKGAPLEKTIILEKKVRYFLKSKMNRSDLFISEINLQFVENFHDWLTTNGKLVGDDKYEGGLNPATAYKVMFNLKAVAKAGFRRQGITYNPFDDFKISFTPTEREPLTMEEVQRIQTKEFKIKRLERVRDRAIVGIYTGMANADIQSCTKDMIRRNLDTGEQWIDRGRTKTGELCLIPLWQPVLDIIEKYKDDEDVKSLNRLFPQISLDKMNGYLQEIADLCGITKKLTTHIFRHTYADFYLNAGGTLEMLARILGHSTTKSTRGYAKHNMATIMAEASIVRDKLMGSIVKMEFENKKIG